MGYRSEKVEIKINLIVDQFIEVQLYLRVNFMNKASVVQLDRIPDFGSGG